MIGTPATAGIVTDRHAFKHTWNNDPSMTDPTATTMLIRLIAMRLHIREGELLPFDHITAHKLRSADQVVVFVVQEGKPVVLTDEWPLFPSDTLITQLRVMLGGKIND